MRAELKKQITELLTEGVSVQGRTEIEGAYPLRLMKSGSEVTRLCPSPTGFVHIGTIFAGLICQFVARQSDGVYILRIEDTDKNREVQGSKELIAKQLENFELTPDEGLLSDGQSRGDYGPYVQSERKRIYLAFALELLESGRAYPCFATNEELKQANEDQKAKKMRPGYYGEWAIWRDRTDDEIREALVAKKPFVLRFKSQGDHHKRIKLNDEIKGQIELPENDLDVPLIKSDQWRLPTYHLAHVVDDYLMRSTIILRGEEWLPSTPLHFELCDALGIPRFRYGHIPLISIVDQNGGKRKLSKRKDPEADVAFWLKQAYPLRAIKAYLLGLANSNFEDWYRINPRSELSDFNFNLKKLASSRSPLLDIKKVEDYAKDEIAQMSQDKFNKEVLAWCEVHNHSLFEAMMHDPEYTRKVLAIERDGENPRKDVAKWSDAPDQFGYFYDEIFKKMNEHGEIDHILDSQFEPELIKESCEKFLKTFNFSSDKDTWFSNLKKSSIEAGFAENKKLYGGPSVHNGVLADFAKIIRVKLTGKTRTPDLWTIMRVMGEQRVRSRLSVM